MIVVIMTMIMMKVMTTMYNSIITMPVGCAKCYEATALPDGAEIDVGQQTAMIVLIVTITLIEMMKMIALIN